jgi:hypothetical protein
MSMRAVEILRALAPFLAGISAFLLTSRRRVIRMFEQAEATSEARAIAGTPGPPLGAWWLKRLEQSGVIVSTDAGTRWLNHDAWESYRAIRRRRALTIAAVLIGLLFVYLWRQ